MSQAFYSPIDRLAEQMPRAKGTGAEFLTELSKRPGYKPVEAQDRDLQTLAALPKMERAQFLQKLKHQRAVVPETETRTGGDTAHEEWTLPGGTNYREILLTHPGASQTGGFPGVAAHFGGAPNVLASIRAKDRVGPNGEKILHLEEIQSDWHQQGRKEGYVPRGVDVDKEARIKHNEYVALRQKLADARRASNQIDQDLASGKPLFQDPAVRARLQARNIEHNNAIMDLTPQVMRAEDAQRTATHLAQNAISDAPYKKNWHELALKKMIHHAAERGYTHLAITPGAEQAKRYGLSRYLNSVSYRKSGDDNYHLVGKGKNDELVLPGHSLAPEDLHKFVGEELANRIRSTATNDPQHITGIGLDVGGEGMKGFYDKMVPDFLNKFGKKYGAQVQPGAVPIVTTPAQHHGITESQFQAQTPEEQQRMVSQHAYAHKGAKTEVPVHMFPITPEMRKDVLANGLPLYAEGGGVSRETIKQPDFFPEEFSSRKTTVGKGQGNLDSKGQQITGAKQGQQNFWKWFKGSHAADKSGKPIRLYHSTNSDISSFKTHLPSSNNYGILGDVPVTRAATFLTPDTKFSQEYLREGHGQNVMPVHAALKKPFDLRQGLTDKQWHELETAGVNTRAVHNAMPWELFDNDENNQNHFVDTLKKLGYDSAVFHEDSPGGIRGSQTTYAAFHPHQIKSAIGNRGTYDPGNPDITKAKGGSIKYSVRDDTGAEHPCNDFSHAQNKARSMLSYKKTAHAHILEDGTPKWMWELGKALAPVGHAKGGPVEEDVPRETVKAYKLFRVHKDHPGKLFPLFIGKHEPVEMNKWVPAEHIPTKGFAERPGWHAGDLPMATHIGEKSDNSLTAPDTRPHNQVWTEVELPNDVDWQTEANKRGTNKHGRVIPVKAHITDQPPTGGHYRYKTNPHMTGSWLIGGAMKVNKILSDKEVKAINRTAKTADLPRQQPFDRKAFGLATGGTISLDQMRHELTQRHK